MPVPSPVSVKGCIQRDPGAGSTVAGCSRLMVPPPGSFLIRHGSAELEKQRMPGGWGLKQLLGAAALGSGAEYSPPMSTRGGPDGVSWELRVVQV